MNVTTMTNGVEVYPFSYLNSHPEEGLLLLKRIRELADTIQQPLSGKLTDSDERELLIDNMDYAAFIIDHSLKEVDFGCLFIIRDGDQIPAYLLSFHNHQYLHPGQKKEGVSQYFPMHHFQEHLTHDLAFLRDLNLMGPFAYCFQIGVHRDWQPKTRSTAYSDLLLNAFERYYAHCVLDQPNREKEAVSETRRKKMSLNRNPQITELDTLIYAAAVHESHYRTIRKVQRRNLSRKEIGLPRHTDIKSAVDFRALFLNHKASLNKDGKESYWFRIVQLPDRPKFLRSIDYKKTRHVARTLIPIQLNIAVSQVNEVLNHIDAKVLWSSFFFDRRQDDGRSLLPAESHGFFQSLLDVQTKNTYQAVLKPLKLIMKYLHDKASRNDSVLSLTHSFRKNQAQIFFFDEGSHSMTSFPNPVAVFLKDEVSGLQALKEQLQYSEGDTIMLSPEEKAEWLASIKAYGAGKMEEQASALRAPNDKVVKERNEWVKRLSISAEEVTELQTVIRKYLKDSPEKLNLEDGVSNEFTRIRDRINKRKHLSNEKYKQLSEYFQLHKNLYEVDRAAFPDTEGFWWCHCVMPINTSFHQEVSGIMFTFRCRKLRDSHPEAKRRMNVVAQTISASLPRTLLNNIIRLQNVYSAELATRYSISAITTRNMAHHLGSHILDNLDSASAISRLLRNDLEGTFPKDMALFMGYIRTKTHLLADLTSTNPVSSVSSWLDKEVLAGFRSQYIMKRFVSGTNIKTIHLDYFGQDGTPDEDILVQIPNGDLGRHAFYMLITNIIRNAAKYEEPKGEEMTITVKLVSAEHADASSNNVPVRRKNRPRGFGLLIYDNVPRKAEKIHALVSDLGDKIKKQQSRLGNDIRTSGWGLQEMTAAAAYLRKKGAEHSLSGGFDEVSIPLLSPEAVEIKSDGQVRHFLGYRIYLKKPRLALFISDQAVTAEDKLPKWHSIYGIRYISEVDVIADEYRNYSHSFVVATYAGCRNSVENSKRFPLRWLKVSAFNDGEMERYLRGDSAGELTLHLWRTWLEQYCTNKGLRLADYSLYQIDKGNPLLPVIHQQPYGKAIVYDHHGNFLPDLIDKDELAYYQNYGSVDPTGRIIASRKRGDQAGWEEFRLQLIEAALTKVLILDERIQRQTIEKSEEDNPQYQQQKFIASHGITSTKDHFLTLKRMNIHLPDARGGIVLDRGKQEAPAREWLRKMLDKKDVDFVVVHLGLLESWIGSSMKDIKTWLIKNVMNVNPRPEIVLISGRGRPVNFPERFCYLPASTVAEYTVSGPPSKYHLVQMLFSSRTRLNI